MRLQDGHIIHQHQVYLRIQKNDVQHPEKHEMTEEHEFISLEEISLIPYQITTGSEASSPVVEVETSIPNRDIQSGGTLGFPSLAEFPPFLG